MKSIKKYLYSLLNRRNTEFYQTLPKYIYFFWYDGIDNLPDLIKINIDEWGKLNPEFQITLVDKNIVNQIDLALSIDYTQIPIQALSDILRAYLLSTNGGIWVDCTVFPVKPLKKWLPQNMKTEFFAFHCHHAKDCLLSSWFLASIKDGEVMQNWYHETLRYWSKPRNLLMDPRLGDPYPQNGYLAVSPSYANHSGKFPYFWFHYLFTYLVNTNKRVATIWGKVPNISSTPLHELQNYLKSQDNITDKEVLLITKNKPMEKLDWRIDEKKVDLFKNMLTSRRDI